ncbi:MAG: Flp family type IVb pilin [Actinobacteria bacterium]|nr:Flp family type IVb pilin [Actinomycetota bacterium]
MKKFLVCEDGQGLGEYALILSLIAVVALLAVTGVGEEILAFFERVITTWPS